MRVTNEVEDILLVPVTINYDKVYEGQQFPFELLGEEKPKESLLKTLKQFLLVKEKTGKVMLKYCKPISFKQFIETFASS